jgi:hypothetical protein
MSNEIISPHPFRVGVFHLSKIEPYYDTSQPA